MHQRKGTELCEAAEVLQNRTFSSPITHSALCPQMDLLALVLNAKTIIVQRFNWQRLATIVPSDASEEKITSITWSPDGALIAVGLNSGRLTLYPVDTASSIGSAGARRSGKDASVPLASKTLMKYPTSLHWTALEPVSESDSIWEAAYADRAESELLMSSSNTDRSRAILAVGDADGCITFYGCDLGFSIAKTRVMPMGYSVQNIHISKTLQCCVALGMLEGSLLARSLSIPGLSSSYPELWRVGVEVVAVNASRSELQTLIKKISEKWASTLDNVLTKSVEKLLYAAMTGFNENPALYGPWEVLRDVHRSAELDGAVKNCLASEIGESGAKEALRAFRCSVDDMDESLLAAVAVAEKILFRASEYRGLASLSSRFDKVGVNTVSAERALESASAVFSELTSLMLKFYQVCSEIEAFLAWLVGTAQKADKEPEEAAQVPGISKAEEALVKSFFQRHLSNIESGSADIVTRTLSNRVLPSLEQFHIAAEELVISLFNAMSTSLSESSGATFPFTAEKAVAQNASIIERSCAESDQSLIEVCIPGEDGQIVTARYIPEQAQWQACCLHLELAGETLLDWIHVHDLSFLFVTCAKIAQSAANAEPGTVYIRVKACTTGALDRGGFLPVAGHENEKIDQELKTSIVDAKEITTVQEMSLSAKFSNTAMLRVRGSVASITLQSHRTMLLKFEELH